MSSGGWLHSKLERTLSSFDTTLGFVSTFNIEYFDEKFPSMLDI